METEAAKKPGRGAYLLPNMFTAASMFLGFLAIVWSGQNRVDGACIAVLVAALMDSLDGKVARMTNTASDFGVQFDSLADLAAFGMAPAILLWNWQLDQLGRIGVGAAFIFAACGALRLARFNVTTLTISKRFFVGLPIPAGGCSLVTFALFAKALPESVAPALPYAAAILTVGVGLLMVSRVNYFSFKEFDVFRAHPVRTMVSFLFMLGLLFSAPRIFGFIFCLLYIAGGLFYTWVMLPRRGEPETPRK